MPVRSSKSNKQKTIKNIKAKAKKTVKRVKAKKPARSFVKKVKAAKIKALGKVTHYYDRIGVAIVELERPLKVGDLVCFKRGDREVVQEVASLQIEHMSVPVAKKGEVVGLKVQEEVHEGALVLPA